MQLRKDAWLFKRQSYLTLYRIYKFFVILRVIFEKDMFIVRLFQMEVVGFVHCNEGIDRNSHLYDQDRQKQSCKLRGRNRSIASIFNRFDKTAAY